MRPTRSVVALMLTLMLFTGSAQAQKKKIVDEADVPEYTLPDALLCADGSRIDSAEEWMEKRRPEILELFRTYVYGVSPGMSAALNFNTLSVDTGALSGKATRKEVEITFTPDGSGPTANVLMYIPNNVSGPVPAFLGLNFYGNHTVYNDPAITLSDKWMRANERMAIVDHRATEGSRGLSAHRWQLEMLIDRGYALVTVYCGDFDPDYDDGFQDGLHPLFYEKGQRYPKVDEWGTIGAWAWGLSRVLDYLSVDSDVDEARVAVIGHSRLGKTALWAGAQDERFALVISNNSGCGGAALSRRCFGETIEMINRNFPHWFCDNFNRYSNNESALPVDQHMLVALSAPRPVYVASAQDDLHADPHGEFLSAYYASPVYRLFGFEGIASGDMPGVNTPVGDRIGYHMRSGGHNVTAYDWERYLDFADRHMRAE